MKKLILYILFFGGFINSYAQNGELIAKQAVQIQKLKDDKVKDSISNNDKINQLKDTINSKELYLEKKNNEIKNLKDSFNEEIKDTVKSLNNIITNLTKDTSTLGKKNIDLNKRINKLNHFKIENNQLNDSINNLNDTIRYKSGEITRINDIVTKLNDTIISKNSVINKLIEKNKTDSIKSRNTGIDIGKNEIKNTVVETYKTTSFDKLVNITSLTLLKRDKKIIGDNKEIEQIITDLETYFEAEKSLSIKFNEDVINSNMDKLSQIERESELIDDLDDKLYNYKKATKKLNTIFEQIVEVDQTISKNQADKVIKAKRNKILGLTSSYIYNYDDDYPYLTGIVLEIIKLKTPNPDANISDLLNKLN